MSKEGSLKIQTWLLKVYIHCDGCDRDVKKTLEKIAGVLTVKIDKEQNKVTVSGTAAPALLIEKLKKKMGKHAELLNAHKSNKSNPDPPGSRTFMLMTAKVATRTGRRAAAADLYI